MNNGILLLLLMAILCTSCFTLHPPYQRPCLEQMPDHWRFSADEMTTAINMKWWEQFQDPVLSNLILEALHNNLDLQVAIVRVREYEAQYRVIRSQLFPQISGQLSFIRQEIPAFDTGVLLGLDRINNQYTALLNLSYEIDIWGRIWSATETAFAQYLQQVEIRRTVVQNVVSSVADAYIQLRQFDKQLQIARNTVKSFIESYELAVTRFEGGQTSELEVKQAESQVETAVIQVKQLEILVTRQEDLLSVFLGRTPDAVERGNWLDNIVPIVDVPAGLPSELLRQRPDILSAEQNLIASNANIGFVAAEMFPQFSLTGFFGSQSLLLKNLFSKQAQTWLWGINMLQPLFTGGGLYNQVLVAEAQNQEAFYEYLSTVLTALKEVNDALITLQKDRELLDVQARQVKVLTDYLELARLRYNEGETDYLNVLDAERNLFSAQLNHAEAQSNIFRSEINLYKSLGGGWVVDADAIALCGH